MRYSLILVLLVNAFVMILPSAYASQTAPVIMILGDSLSAAPGVSYKANWPHLLQLQLQEKGYPHKVVNASVSGDTTRNGLTRLPAALKTHQPNIVIIALGGNDGLQALPPSEMQNNLTQMIDLVKKTSAKVLLCGVRLPPNLGQAYIAQFLTVYQTTAAETKVALVPFILNNVAANPDLMLSDGIHPNERAQPIVMQNVWAGLRPLL